MVMHSVCLQSQYKFSVEGLLHRVIGQFDVFCTFAIHYPFHILHKFEQNIQYIRLLILFIDFFFLLRGKCQVEIPRVGFPIGMKKYIAFMFYSRSVQVVAERQSFFN